MGVCIFMSLSAGTEAGVECSVEEQGKIQKFEYDDVEARLLNCVKRNPLNPYYYSHDDYTQCVESLIEIGAECSECFWENNQYPFKNCEAACLLGWCKQGCLSCTGVSDWIPTSPCTEIQV